ncbi:MAG: EamA family transporter [Cephaloticoccus sp.]
MTSSWQFWALASAVFAALTAILAKVGVSHVDSDAATFVRTGVVLIIALGIVVAGGKAATLAQFTARNWLFLTLSGAATGLSWICYFRALQRGPASKVAPIDKLSVVFVAILAVLFLGERATPRDWLGIAMIAAGAVILALGR